MNYYIIFSAYEKDKYHSGVIAKRYTCIDEKLKEFCNIFKFSIVDEEEFNNIKTRQKIVI
jgi:hypothetical protein